MGDDEPPYRCGYCDRMFTTKTGRGLHARRAHPIEFNEAIDTERVRARWSPEDLLLLATHEKRIKETGFVGQLNHRLAEVMPGRTVNSIRCTRSKREYRIIYGELNLRAGGENEIERPRFIPQAESRGELTAALDRISARLVGVHPSLGPDVLRGVLGRAIVGEDVTEALGQWLRVFLVPRGVPLENRAGVRVPGRGGVGVPRRRNPRRIEYARVQELWKTDKRAAVAEVLGEGQANMAHGIQELEAYWAPIMEVRSSPWEAPEVHGPRIDDASGIWIPITSEEAAGFMPAMNSAAGLDRVTVERWRGVPGVVREAVLNCILAVGRVPVEQLRARVTMIPKTERPAGPGDYRPIAVASVIVRHLHKILAYRLMSVVRHVPEQKGFQMGVDGAAINVFLLDSLLRNAWKKKRNLGLAVLDVRKAFDSVSRHAILAVARGRGLPEGFCRYLEGIYDEAVSVIWARGRASKNISPGRGVRQGDPLSPTLFNMVMDHVIESSRSRIGFMLGATRVSVLAYADDLIFAATGEDGLNYGLKRLEEALRECGLELNPEKCVGLVLKTSGTKRLVKVGPGSELRVSGQAVRTLGIEDCWEYLGVTFSHRGAEAVVPGWRNVLSRLDRAPLKPQQKLEALRNYVLPRWLHGLVLGRPIPRELRRIDVGMRALVRKWLHLPHDSSNAFIHARRRDGGLGVPSLVRMVPYFRARRLCGVAQELGARGATEEIRSGLGGGLIPPEQLIDVNAVCANELYECVDGNDLRECADVPASTAWTRTGAKNMTGRDFVSYARLVGGALPTRVRTSRGQAERRRAATCRIGCGVLETTDHVMSRCIGTKLMRIRRHHNVVRLLRGSFDRRGWRTWLEPHFASERGAFRPDLVVAHRQEAWILDVHVVTASGPMLDKFDQKKARYDTPEVKSAVAALAEVDVNSVRVLPVTLSYKGVWCRRSALILGRLGVRKLVLEWAADRVRRGSTAVWWAFNADPRGWGPAERRPREGIG